LPTVVFSGSSFSSFDSGGRDFVSLSRLSPQQKQVFLWQSSRLFFPMFFAPKLTFLTQYWLPFTPLNRRQERKSTFSVLFPDRNRDLFPRYPPLRSSLVARPFIFPCGFSMPFSRPEMHQPTVRVFLPDLIANTLAQGLPSSLLLFVPRQPPLLTLLL